ncbi:MAG: kinase/pyrophosphorylase [Eggerthellaceae bacterium]|nr:kinase/pyrophosphorylase [Eggerthellaceae bacterium]
MVSTSQNAPLASLPTIHIISDSVGITGQALARAAASQFGESNPRIEVLSKITSFDEIKLFFEEHCALHEQEYGTRQILVFYTLVDRDLSDQLMEYVETDSDIVAVDLMGDALGALASISGRDPAIKPGSLHEVDRNYFKRIEALEFTIAHDDGRNPQDLKRADIVLVGVSRSSKTPLAIYLSQEGYKVANVPLDLQTDPPKELFEIEPTRLYGLMTTPEILIGIRRRRLGNASAVASDYADPEKVYLELEKARALMRKLGCIVVHTDNRAVEETAQEILRYYEQAHPTRLSTL